MQEARRDLHMGTMKGKAKVMKMRQVRVIAAAHDCKDCGPLHERLAHAVEGQASSNCTHAQ